MTTENSLEISKMFFKISIEACLNTYLVLQGNNISILILSSNINYSKKLISSTILFIGLANKPKRPGEARNLWNYQVIIYQELLGIRDLHQCTLRVPSVPAIYLFMSGRMPGLEICERKLAAGRRPLDPGQSAFQLFP